jgi:Flp pilus assembly CpaF family ATPase
LLNLYSDNPPIERAISQLLPIRDLLRDPNAQEVSINSRGKVYVDWGVGAMQDTGITVADAAARAAIRLLLAASGGYLDPEAPFATLRLACGARFHGVLRPVSDEPQISIRTHRRILRSLRDFMSEQFIEILHGAVAARKSITIGGATSAGKTTLLNAVLNLIPKDQRLVIIEDAPEIQIETGRNVVRRLATGRADLRRHVFEALRDRPDWLIVGETRDESARDLLDAARTGHPGLSTVHASSANGIITRLMSLAGCDYEFVKEAVDLAVFLQRMPDGRRAVTEIREVSR